MLLRNMPVVQHDFWVVPKINFELCFTTDFCYVFEHIISKNNRNVLKKCRYKFIIQATFLIVFRSL